MIWIPLKRDLTISVLYLTLGSPHLTALLFDPECLCVCVHTCLIPTRSHGCLVATGSWAKLSILRGPGCF